MHIGREQFLVALSNTSFWFTNQCFGVTILDTDQFKLFSGIFSTCDASHLLFACVCAS